MLHHGPRVRITEERFSKVEDFFRKHGGKAVFIGRWLGLVRPLMPFLAGASGMSYRRFVPYDILGAGLWSATWCLLGYIFWQSFEQVASTAGRGTIAFAILLGLFIGVYQAIKRLRHPEQREAFGTLARPPDAAAPAAPAGLGRARGVDRGAPVLAVRAATAVGADRSAAALSRRPPHPGRARHRAHDAAGDRRACASTR